MSKKLLLAPAAAGKTEYLLDLAANRARVLQDEVRVCVPGRLQAQAWRQRLARSGNGVGVRVLNFDELAAACLNAAGETYVEPEEAVQFRLLRTIIGWLPLDHYAPLRAKPGFVQVAQRLIAELKAQQIQPEQFTEAVRGLGEEARLLELAQIYAAYQARLRERQWADRAGLHWLAEEALRERAPAACWDWPLLIVDGFDDFNQAQLALLALLSERVTEFIITLPQAENVDFPRYRRTREEVERFLRIQGERMPAREVGGRTPLAHLARHLFAHAAAEPMPAGEAITLREAPDRPAEVRTALRWLKQRLVWDQIPAGGAALLARDITPYRSTIQEVAAEFGLPVRLVEGLPLRQSPVIAALIELLRLFLPDPDGKGPMLPRRQVVSAWRSPYFNWTGGDHPIEAGDADILDLLAREQRVIRGLEQWRAAFSAGLVYRADDPRVEDEEGSRWALTQTAVQRLQEQFDQFLALCQPPPGASTMREFVAWLERLIGPDGRSVQDPMPDDSLHICVRARANPETEAGDVAALNALKEILRGLVWAEEAIAPGEPVTFATFFNELSGAILPALYTPPNSGDEAAVLVANAKGVRGLSFQVAAVMGLSEGSFPQTISEDPFLRDEDRQRMRSQFGLQLEPSTLSAEREYFYDTITRAREKLLLTRPMLAENGAEWVASPYWEAVRQYITCTPEQIPSEPILDPAETASWPEWWETMASAGEAAAAVAEDGALWQRLERAARIWRARQEVEISLWDGDLSSLRDELTEVHGPDQIWSASRLEAYQVCAFLFYLANILGLQPRPEPVEGLDTRQLGSLYHHIFERVTRIPDLDMQDETAVRTAVSKIAKPVLDAAPAEEGFRETPWWMQTRQEIVENVIHSLLLLAGEAYAFYRAEAAFGFGGGQEPLTIMGEGDRLQLRGFIDRIDRREDGCIRIVDYKLGSPYSYTARKFAEGKRLQLPLYALAAEETLGLGPVAEGFYWHFRQAEASPFKLSSAEGGVSGAIETALEFAWDIVGQVREGNFRPLPPDQGCPAYCPGAAFCWHYNPRSW